MWLVIISIGEYSNRVEHPIGVTENEQLAQDTVTKLDSLFALASTEWLAFASLPNTEEARDKMHATLRGIMQQIRAIDPSWPLRKKAGLTELSYLESGRAWMVPIGRIVE